MKSRPDNKYFYSIRNIFDFYSINQFFIHEHDYFFILPRFMADIIPLTQYIYNNPRVTDKCFSYIIDIYKENILKFINNKSIQYCNLRETYILPWESFKLSDILQIDPCLYNKFIDKKVKIDKQNNNKRMSKSFIYSDICWKKNLQRDYPFYFFDIHYSFLLVMALNRIPIFQPKDRFTSAVLPD